MLSSPFSSEEVGEVANRDHSDYKGTGEKFLVVQFSPGELQEALHGIGGCSDAVVKRGVN